LRNKLGEQELSLYMVELGEIIAKQYQGQLKESETLKEKLTELVQIMTELGYEARACINTEAYLK